MDQRLYFRLNSGFLSRLDITVLFRLINKVWTTYFPYSKSKPKTTPFSEVIRVQILWLTIMASVKHCLLSSTQVESYLS